MRAYSVHCKKRNITQVLGRYDTLKLLMTTDTGDKSAHDIMFAIDEYGPQMIADQYLITSHDISNLH